MANDYGGTSGAGAGNAGEAVVPCPSLVVVNDVEDPDFSSLAVASLLAPTEPVELSRQVSLGVDEQTDLATDRSLTTDEPPGLATDSTIATDEPVSLNLDTELFVDPDDSSADGGGQDQ